MCCSDLHFRDKVFSGGLTYNSHPLGCATALATIAVYEQDNLIERAAQMGQMMGALHHQMLETHRCVGAVRNIGLFGIFELVRSKDTLEPLASFNGTSPEMQALAKAFRQNGLYTMVRWNTFMTNPPLTISEAELHEGFDTIDKALSLVDGML